MKCGLPILSKNQNRPRQHYLCYNCRKRRRSFDLARSVYFFDGPVRKAIHLIKYHKHFGLCKWLGREMINNLLEYHYHTEDGKDTIIIPVPLSRERLREREFNQAEVLATAASGASGLPVFPSLLKRSDNARPQVGLSIKDRYSNVRGVFRVRKSEYLKNKTVILIDDVITTGATVNECSKALKCSGAKCVNVWTLATAMQSC